MGVDELLIVKGKKCGAQEQDGGMACRDVARKSR